MASRIGVIRYVLVIFLFTYSRSNVSTATNLVAPIALRVKKFESSSNVSSSTSKVESQSVPCSRCHPNLWTSSNLPL